MRPRDFLWILLCLLIPVNAKTGGTIGYNEYMSLIKKNLTALKISRISLEKASAAVGQARGTGDTGLTASAEISKDRTSSGSGSYAVDSSRSTLFSLGASKKILYTGTTISAGVSYLKTKLKAHTLAEPQNVLDYTAEVPTLTINVSQPLLKNAFGLSDRAAVTEVKLAREAQRWQTDTDNQNALVSFSTVYFQWLGQIKTLAFLKTSLSNAALSEKQAKAQFAAGLIDNDDYQSTKNLYLQYQNSILTYEQALTAIRTKLNYYFDAGSINPDPAEWDTFLAHIITNTFKYKTFKTTRKARILNITEKQFKSSVTAAANSTLPDLSLYGSLSLTGSSDDTLSAAFTGSAASPEYAIGLSLTFPLENRTARNTLKTKELELQSLIWQYDQTKQDYETQLKSLLEEINTRRRILQNTAERLKALHSMYATQRVRHSQGRISQTTLNDTLIKIAAEEISLVENQYSLIALMFDYETLIY